MPVQIASTRNPTNTRNPANTLTDFQLVTLFSLAGLALTFALVRLFGETAVSLMAAMTG
jgi:hypothetical protein